MCVAEVDKVEEPGSVAIQEGVNIKLVKQNEIQSERIK